MESLPDVRYDIGEFYSGSVPIDEGNSSRTLFFAFKPRIGEPVDEVTIWLNGGPGCSSLEGFLQENGPFLWESGTYLPTPNPYSWANLTNMLWIEQPVGTGYTQGTPTATSQEQTAQDFIKFFKNWENIFGIQNYKIFVTGESYAGRYVPYISAAMVDQNDTTYYNISGALIYDPSIGSGYAQEDATVVPFVQANANLFNLNSSVMDSVTALDQSCGFADWREKYLTFPPPGPQPSNLSSIFRTNPDCAVFDTIFGAALTTNPCFDIYEINQQCPLLWDVLSFPTALEYTPEGANTYFNRTDVKQAMHAPLNKNWEICANGVLRRDTSAMSIEHAIPQVIEATNRFLISSGDFDMILITNGTLSAIQNMTWNGQLGFQEAPSTPINIQLPDLQYQSVFAANGEAGVDGAQGVMGIQHYERGLMWAETYLSGHMQPEFQPRVTYRHLEWVLGRIDTL